LALVDCTGVLMLVLALVDCTGVLMLVLGAGTVLARC
jgi:hypothetical protein